MAGGGLVGIPGGPRTRPPGSIKGPWGLDSLSEVSFSEEKISPQAPT